MHSGSGERAVSAGVLGGQPQFRTGRGGHPLVRRFMSCRGVWHSPCQWRADRGLRHAADPATPGFSERLSCLSPFHNCSIHLKIAEFWPELAGPVCSLKTFDDWLRTDGNWDCLPMNNDNLLLTNDMSRVRMLRCPAGWLTWDDSTRIKLVPDHGNRVQQSRKGNCRDNARTPHRSGLATMFPVSASRKAPHRVYEKHP